MKRLAFILGLLGSSSIAIADLGAGAPQNMKGYDSLILIAGFLVVFYFFMIRPQQKRAKEHKTLLEGLSKGDEVLTTGGLLAKVLRLNDQFIVVSIAEGVEITIQKQSIRTVLPKGTLKSVTA